MTDIRTVNARIPAELHEWLKRRVIDRGTTQSLEIENALLAIRGHVAKEAEENVINEIAYGTKDRVEVELAEKKFPPLTVSQEIKTLTAREAWLAKFGPIPSSMPKKKIEPEFPVDKYPNFGDDL